MPSSMKSAIEAAGRRDRLLREETKEDGAQPSCGAEERRPGHVTSAALGAVRSRSRSAASEAASRAWLPTELK